LSNNDAEEGIDLGRRRRRRRSIARSNTRAWSSSSRHLGFVPAPQGAARVPFSDIDKEASREVSFGLFLVPRG
jgi:hypothetical protein